MMYDMVGGVYEMGRRLGNAHQQGVQSTNEQIGREAAGHTGKGGGQTGHGMAAIGPKDHGAQGNQDDVARVGGHVGQDAQENHHGGDQPLGGSPVRCVSSRALIRPECSATPTPSMATSTMPKGA